MIDQVVTDPPSALRPIPWRLILGLFLFAVVTYLPALRNGFVWDDRMLVMGDIVVGRVPLAEAFRRDFWDLGAVWGGTPGYYRPLATLSLALDQWVGGGAAWPFHGTNILLHGAATVAAWFAARRFGAADDAATWGAAIFAVHPHLTETVAWISGRPDLLGTALLLGALALRGPSSWVLGGLALLSKEIAILWPLLAAIRDRGGRPRDRLPEIVVLLTVLALRKHLLGAALPAQGFGEAKVAVLAVLHAAGFFLVPWWTPAIYVPPGSFEASSPAIYLGALGFVALLPLLWRVPSIRPWVGAAAVAYGPVLPLMSSPDVLGMRPLYLPAAFLFVPVGIFATRCPPWVRRRGLPLVLVFLAISTAWGTRLWRDDLSFSIAAASGFPASSRVLTNLAVAQRSAGDRLAAWEATELALAAGSFDGAWQVRGELMAEVGCSAEAVEAFRSALRLNPGFAPAWDALTRLLLSTGRPREAERALAAAWSVGQRDPVYRDRMAKAKRTPGEDRPLRPCDPPELRARLGASPAR